MQLLSLPNNFEAGLHIVHLNLWICQAAVACMPTSCLHVAPSLYCPPWEFFSCFWFLVWASEALFGCRSAVFLGTSWCQQWGYWGTCECSLCSLTTVHMFPGCLMIGVVMGGFLVLFNRRSDQGSAESDCFLSPDLFLSVPPPAPLAHRGCLACLGWRWEKMQSTQSSGNVALIQC